MTDDQIRAWLSKPVTKGMKAMDLLLPLLDTSDCLTELLAHRELHRSIKWAVWVRDQSAVNGWRFVAAFEDQVYAHAYKSDMVTFRKDLGSSKDVLVLPANEVPCLTAR